VLLVSNEAVDHKAAEQRLERWKSVGWTALGLVGLAVPVVGLVLFGKLVVDLLGEVYTGIEDWSEGHQHEAREHLLHVAQSVLVTGRRWSAPVQWRAASRAARLSTRWNRYRSRRGANACGTTT
jgi:hypothetical protein